MKKPLVSVFDSATESFSSPMCVAAIGQATRSFADEVRRQDAPERNPMFHHPEHFVLYHVGFFDELTGRVDALDLPVVVLRGESCKEVRS